MKKLWSIVRRWLLAIGRVQTMILMGLVYYLFIGPMALLYQLLMGGKTAHQSFWIKRPAIKDVDLYLKRQF